MKNPAKKPFELGAILGCIFLMPLVVVLSIPGALFVVSYIRVRDKRLFNRLKAQHRVIDWKEMEAHLSAGLGTLIIEQANKIGARFWWTPDDLVAIAPVPALSLEEIGLDYIRGKSSEPFILWCFQNYLSEKGGKALLAHSRKLSLPPGPVQTDFLQSQYPNAKIVQMVLLTGK